jgi:DNA-binding beta-propeller fold protein YncE
MRRFGKLIIPVVAALAAPFAAGSCTASTGPSYPSGAHAVPPSFTTLSVSGLPAACSGQTFYEASTSLCSAEPTYFFCDGNSYTEYDCAYPGTAWTLETLSQYDRAATGPSPCNGNNEGSLAGTVYVEGNVAAPGENAVLAFHYCQGALPSVVAARYSTGGSGAADLDDRGILDADQQVVVNADQTLLFAVNQGSDSIAAFHIAADGSLTTVTGSPFPSGGPAPGSVGVTGNILVVANKGSDGVRKLSSRAPNYATFAIQTDGSLTPTGSTFTLPLGASPTQAFTAPGGKFVFGTEESGTLSESGVLRAFRLTEAGLLTSVSQLSLANSLFHHGVPDPVWPAGLSATPTASVLYTGIPNNNSIATFDIAPTGELSLVGGAADLNGFLPCWSLVSNDGHRLYFANAGSDNISVFDIATDARHPSLLQTFELQGGGNPWGLRIDPTGQLLFVITPRQVRQVPVGQGQLLHGMRIAADGTLEDEIDGSPVTIPVAPATNPFGVAVAARR